MIQINMTEEETPPVTESQTSTVGQHLFDKLREWEVSAREARESFIGKYTPDEEDNSVVKLAYAYKRIPLVASANIIAGTLSITRRFGETITSRLSPKQQIQEETKNG
jgi:hypothetical protein